MYQTSSTPANSSNRSSPGLTSPRLHGIGLGFARSVWVIVVVLLLAFFLANLPVYVAQLQTVCLHPRCAPWQLAPASVSTLQRLHVSLGEYALVSLLISMASVCVWCAVAAVIFWRQSQLGMALLMALLLVVQGITQMSDPIQTPLEYTAQGWQRAAVLGATLDLSLALIVFSVFPNGRFVPGWMRWLVALLTAALWIYVFATAASVPWETVLNPLTIGIFAAVMGSIIGAQIYRYRRVSTWAERQQTKWVVLGMIEGVLVGVLYFVPPQVFPPLGQHDIEGAGLHPPLPVCSHLHWDCPAPLSPLGHRRHHQSHPGLRLAQRHSGRHLPREHSCHRESAGSVDPTGVTGAVSRGHRDLHPDGCCPLQSAAPPAAAAHRSPLLPQQI